MRIFSFFTFLEWASKVLLLYFLFMLIILFIIPVIALSVYILYVFVKDPTTFRAKVDIWLRDFKHGYVGAGMPLWWVRFSKTYLAMFIRVRGGFCVTIKNVVMPNYPRVDLFVNSNYFVNSLVLIMYFLFFVYATVFSTCSFWSCLKYLLKGGFIKYK